jgi:uncharacterized protein YkwD
MRLLPLLLFASLTASAPDWRAEFLSAHNALRAKVGAPPLRWSNSLEAHARQWAATLLRQNRLDHRPQPIYGENLLDIENAPAAPRLVVESWASEARDYDLRRAVCRTRCGHYTQMIWSDTRELGCAAARGPSREVWVCNYNPPGNIAGESAIPSRSSGTPPPRSPRL